MRVDNPPFVVELFLEVLEAVVVHIVTPVGGKAVQGKRIANAIDGRADQGGRFAGQFQNRFV